MEKDLHSLLAYSIIYTERNKGKQKEYPMTNSEETRSKLAKEVVETMTLEDLTSFVMQRLEQDYENDNDLFEEDVETYFPEDTKAAVEDYVFWREATEGVK
jgi:hypothetical protein